MSVLAAIGWKVVPRIGPVSPHGLGIAVGYALGGSLLARRAERMYGIARDHVWNMLMWAVLGVVVGARLFYVVGHIADYIPEDPLGIFRIWEGGIVFYGGAIGGIVAAVPYMRKHNLKFWHVMDAAAPGFPLGLIFGRIGDLVIGDHLGGPTDFFLGFRYEGGINCTFDCLPDRVLPIGAVVHQTALYDLINVLLLFPVVMLLGRKRRPDGFLMMFTATWYGGARLITDFARDARTYAGLSGTQWVSVAIIVLGTAYLIRLSRRGVVTEPVIDHEMARAEEAAMIVGEPSFQAAAETTTEPDGSTVEDVAGDIDPAPADPASPASAAVDPNAAGDPAAATDPGEERTS